MIKRFFAAFLLLTLWLGTACAEEHISSFIVDITVRQDGRIDIIETIHVLSQGHQIKRGIVREIPTLYEDTMGTQYSVDCALQSVLHNDSKAEYHTESASNGIRIFIGNATKNIALGYHTYTIAYSTNRQIGYFQDHDELFWNITGNGWRLPIMQARFIIHLPEGIPSESMRVVGYTGYMGDLGTNYTAHIAAHGTITGSTTRALQPHQGLSIAVAWPKGYMTQPSWWMWFYYFFHDNWPLIVLFLVIFGCFFAYLYVWASTLPLRRSGVVIPLFYPPEYLCPAQIACIDAIKYNHKALTASLVNLAVKGAIKIECKQRNHILSSASYYILHKLVSHDDPLVQELHYHELSLFKNLFKQGDTCTLDGQSTVIASAMRSFQDNLEKNILQQAFFDSKSEQRTNLYLFSFIVFISVMASGCASYCYAWIMNFWFWAATLLMIGVHVWGSWLIKHYTAHGRKIQDQIEGFKLFLNMTEKERMKIVGTPPEQTPQLYETYLPYAIALGVEEQWTKKFEAVFAQMHAAGAPYMPRWHVGHFAYYHGMHASMIRTLNSSMASTIASSGSRPGSQSAFGKGGGFGGGAGRGGGGGGGGGW